MQTASLGVVMGTNVDLKTQEMSDESPWIVIWGGAGSVGQFAIQVRSIHPSTAKFSTNIIRLPNCLDIESSLHVLHRAPKYVLLKMIANREINRI